MGRQEARARREDKAARMAARRIAEARERAQTQTVESSAIHAVVEDPEAPGCYVSDWGVIIPGADVAPEVVEAAMEGHHGPARPEQRTITEVQHVTYQPRVMWCERYGQACEMNGEWHGHWHGVLHNPRSEPSCCHTIAIRTRR